LDDFTFAFEEIIPFYETVEEVISLEFLSERRKFYDYDEVRFAVWED